MRIEEQHLDLISEIYDIALDQRAWTRVLDRICEVTGARLANFNLGDLVQPEIQVVESSSLAGREMIEEYLENWEESERRFFSRMAELPAGRFVSDEEIAKGLKPFDQQPVVPWLKSRLGVFRRSSTRLNDQVSWFDSLTVNYSVDRGPMTLEEKQRAGIFLPHLARAVQLSRPFLLLRQRFRAVVSVLDRIQVGVFVLSASGDVLVQNAEAERIVDAGDGLTRDARGRLVPSSPGGRAAFAGAISAVAATASGDGLSSGEVLAVPRSSAEPEYVVEVYPARSSEIEDGRRTEGALVFVIDPTSRRVVTTSSMQVLFRLTDAEAEICKLVANGHRLQEIAEMRSVSLWTVRSQLRSVFSKTGVSSQSELVRLAVSIHLPVESQPPKPD